MRNSQMFSKQQPKVGMTGTGLSVLLLGLMLFAGACSAPPSPGPNRPMAGQPAGVNPAKPGPPHPSAKAAAQSKMGSDPTLIALANEILSTGANPFLSKLPKPKMEVPVDNGAPQEDAAPVNVFENFQLLGVVLKGTRAMALLSLGSGGGTEMVRAGDMFFANGNQFSVKRIGGDTVELEKVGPAPEVMTLSLPAIVGYGAADKAEDKAESKTGDDPAAPPGVKDGAHRGPRLKLEEL